MDTPLNRPPKRGRSKSAIICDAIGTRLKQEFPPLPVEETASFIEKRIVKNGKGASQ